MNLLEQIAPVAKENPQSICFPEAENEKIMQAAYETAVEGYIHPVLLGDASALKKLCEDRGYDPSVFRFVDRNDEAYRDQLVSRYAVLPGVFLSEKAIRRRINDPLYFSLVMQAVDDVDVTFAGINYTTGDVILAGQTIVGLAEGISTVSSVAFADIEGYDGPEGSIFAFGDSAVCANPTAEQLADIAISSCDTVHGLLDWEPRCALVSYSTKGSGYGELIEKIPEAAKIASERRPDLFIEGEFQLDAAISPAVAAKKVQGESNVAGRANVVIWPDLNAGNIAVKIIQQFAKADAYGPLLQGMRKIVCDCSRGAPVTELKGNIIISCVRAARLKA